VPAPEPDPTPEPTLAPTEAPQPEATVLEYLDVNSNPADIQTAQMALYRFGLLNTDTATVGVLDAATLQGIAAFQLRVNELFGAGLMVIDPAVDVAIDAQTLHYLLYAGIDLTA